MHVLIIESDASFAAGLDDALRAKGIGTTVTADGEAALALARTQRPAAVILALELGERLSAGFSWCNRFKRDEGLRSIPLLLTSALATEETFEHHGRLRTRADSYLRKPFSPDVLLQELSSLLHLDGPPAGSIEGLADEFLQIIPEHELETLEMDELKTLEMDELAELPGDEPSAIPLEDEPLDLMEVTAIPEEEEGGLDDLFADLAPSLPEPEKTVAGFLHEEAAAVAVAPQPPPPPGADVASVSASGSSPSASTSTSSASAAPGPLASAIAPAGESVPSPGVEGLQEELAAAKAGWEKMRQEHEEALVQLSQMRSELDAMVVQRERAEEESRMLRASLDEARLRADRLGAEVDAHEEQSRDRAEHHQAELQRHDRLRELLVDALRLVDGSRE